ncbi:MAG: porin family protein [Gammaproteobacteria bacterium]|nr:porin family protein [Gammaproteobacteria bacterium]
MKPFISVFSFIVMTAMTCLGPPAQADSALIVKAGSFELSDDTQNISGVSLVFDEDASSVFSIEYEWGIDEVVLGGELLSYSNDWDSGLATSGDNDTLAIMFNVKRYFEISEPIQFYIGGGIGIASVDFDGPGGSADGDDLALQVMAGVTFRLKAVGIYTEVKSFSSEPEDDFGDDIDVSGTGLFGGISQGS